MQSAGRLNDDVVEQFTVRDQVRSLRSWLNQPVFANPTAAINAMQAMRAQHSLLDRPQVLAHTHLVEAIALTHQGYYRAADALLNSAESVLGKSCDLWMETEIALHRIRIRIRLGTASVHVEELEALVGSATTLEDPRLTWQILNTIANLHQMYNRIAEAILNMVRACEIAQEYALTFEAHATRMRLATYHQALGLLDDAWQQERDLLHDLGTASDNAHLRMLVLLSHILTCELLQKTEESLTAAVEAHQIAVALDDWSAAGLVAFGQARVSYGSGDRIKTLEFLDATVEAWARGEGPPYRGHDTLAQWYREAATKTWSRETMVQLSELRTAGDFLHRDVLRQVLRALSESAHALGETDLAMQYLREEYAEREGRWRESARQMAHMAALAHDTRAAQLKAELEVSKREELSRAMQEITRLNQENELLIVQLKDQSDKLAILARQDGLTGLDNRRAFEDQLDAAIATFSDCQDVISVGLLDVDDFKLINDQYSHAVGDEVLRRMGQLMARSVRGKGVVARYGGEEFSIMLVRRSRSFQLRSFDSLRKTIEAADWSDIAPGLKVTVSIGVAEVDSTLTLAQVMDRADGFLYEAKASGKNCVKSSSGCEIPDTNC